MGVLDGDSTQGIPDVKPPLIPRHEPTAPPCCQPTRGAAIHLEGSSEPQGELCVLARW
jgi:hypothetical protein